MQKSVCIAQDRLREPNGSPPADELNRFVRLTEPMHKCVYRLAFRIVHNCQDAEDIRQETFLKAHRYLGRFEGRSKFRTWISRIAINEALMFLRRQPKAIHVSVGDLGGCHDAEGGNELRSPVQNPENAYYLKELGDHLKNAIGGLRPGLRVVFLLRTATQLSVAETAFALQISHSAVKSRMRRARIQLQSSLMSNGSRLRL